ncbi:hypothetical protein AEM42_02760 [Betaproteobacteria bacterium UKL13-2]|nr:hypothetical protein AEM42_02760 [Betaproteobacteria bacterium UKL13-2]
MSTKKRRPRRYEESFAPKKITQKWPINTASSPQGQFSDFIAPQASTAIRHNPKSLNPQSNCEVPLNLLYQFFAWQRGTAISADWGFDRRAGNRVLIVRPCP